MTKKKNVKVPKEEVVNVRMTAQQKLFLESVAAQEGLGVSSWMLHESLRAAQARPASGTKMP